MMGGYIFIGLLLLIVYLFIRADVKAGNELGAWYEYVETHRHCCKRPYKTPERNI